MNTKYLRLMQEPAMMDALVNSSVSAEDANLRSREYAKMFARNAELAEMVSGMPNLFRRLSLVMQKLHCCLHNILMHL